MMGVLSQSGQTAVKLLAIDTACAACSVALWADGAVVSSRMRKMDRGQAEALMSLVGEVMQEARADFASLDLIAVTIGPGSFTGLRTGLAAAHGLALAWALPMIGVTTTEAVALAAHRMAPDAEPLRPVTVVLNSRREDLYAQRFAADLIPIDEPFTALPDAIVNAEQNSGIIFAGDATDRIMDIVRARCDGPEFWCFPIDAPDAIFVAEIAAVRRSSGATKNKSAPPKPLYLRAPDAAQPVEQGRLRQ